MAVSMLARLHAPSAAGLSFERSRTTTRASASRARRAGAVSARVRDGIEAAGGPTRRHGRPRPGGGRPGDRPAGGATRSRSASRGWSSDPSLLVRAAVAVALDELDAAGRARALVADLLGRSGARRPPGRARSGRRRWAASLGTEAIALVRLDRVPSMTTICVCRRSRCRPPGPRARRTPTAIVDVSVAGSAARPGRRAPGAGRTRRSPSARRSSPGQAQVARAATVPLTDGPSTAVRILAPAVTRHVRGIPGVRPGPPRAGPIDRALGALAVLGAPEARRRDPALPALDGPGDPRPGARGARLDRRPEAARRRRPPARRGRRRPDAARDAVLRRLADDDDPWIGALARRTIAERRRALPTMPETGRTIERDRHHAARCAASRSSKGSDPEDLQRIAATCRGARVPGRARRSSARASSAMSSWSSSRARSGWSSAEARRRRAADPAVRGGRPHRRAGRPPRAAPGRHGDRRGRRRARPGDQRREPQGDPARAARGGHGDARDTRRTDQRTVGFARWRGERARADGPADRHRHVPAHRRRGLDGAGPGAGRALGRGQRHAPRAHPAGVDAHGGACVRTEGDAFFGVFPEAGAAVAAAVDAQKALSRPRLAGRRQSCECGWASTAARPTWPATTTVASRSTGRLASPPPATAARSSCRSRRALLVAEAVLVDGRLGPRPRPPRAARRAGARALCSSSTSPGCGTDFPPLAHVPTGRGQPAAPDDQLPRTRSTSSGTLGELLAADRLVTLTGPGGIGKTSLAVELARATAETFADGAWFVDLDVVNDPSQVVPVVARTLGLFDGAGAAGGRSPGALPCRAVDPRGPRQLRAPARCGGEPCRVLLRASQGVRIVVTSRAPAARRPANRNTPSSRWVSVGPIPVPRELFVERARAVSPGWDPGADRAAVEDICRSAGRPAARI